MNSGVPCPAELSQLLAVLQNLLGTNHVRLASNHLRCLIKRLGHLKTPKNKSV